MFLEQQQPTYVNMSELASMAALKINTSHGQDHDNYYAKHYQQLSTPASASSPLNSSDSSTTNYQLSPDISTYELITQNTSTTPTSSNTPSYEHNLRKREGSCSNADNMSIGFFASDLNLLDSNDHILSTENDVKCQGSVLDKKSMFEKLEQSYNNNSFSPQPSISSTNQTKCETIYGVKCYEGIYKAPEVYHSPKETGKILAYNFLKLNIKS